MNTGENLNQNQNDSAWSNLEQSAPFDRERAAARQALANTTSSTIRAINYFIGDKGRDAIIDFLDEKSEATYANLNTAEEAVDFFDDYLEEFLKNHPYDNDGIHAYTGLSFGAMNSIARGYWDYNQLGPKTPEKVESARRASEMLYKTILESPELPADLTVYRGINLEGFRDYNFESPNDLGQLEALKGQLFYESGFTSTSVVREKSFFNQQLDDTYRRACNIEVEIHVPKGSHDGVPVHLDYRNTEEFTRRTEFIINSGSLFRIKDVDVDHDANTAHVVMELIPKSVWDPNA